MTKQLVNQSFDLVAADTAPCSARAAASGPGSPVRRVLAFAVDQAAFGAPYFLVGQALHVSNDVEHVLGGVIATIYFTVLWSWIGRGRTVGMRILGLQVERLDGSSLSLGRAFVRNLGLLVSIAVLGVGLFAAFFDPQRRTWADRLAGTRVVDARR